MLGRTSDCRGVLHLLELRVLPVEAIDGHGWKDGGWMEIRKDDDQADG